MRPFLAVLNVIGALLALFGVVYLLPLGAALVYGDRDSLAVFGAGAAACVGAGLALQLATRRFRTELKPRDGYLLVSLGWLLIASVAALPMVWGVPRLSFTDAFFESMSGLSTTGSTVIAGLDALPQAVNLWRHLLHWIGGMGIIVLAVAILPLLGVGGMQMYRAEAPGPVKDAKLTPRITETAKALWLVYAGLTALCVLALLGAGMTPFDAVCHAFSVMSLGGFSTHDANVGFFRSPVIEAVLIVFMLVASMNFATHFQAVRRRDPGVYRRDPEARWVVVWLALSALLVTAHVQSAGLYDGFWTSLRHSTFAVVSMASTTGFVTEDFSLWPLFAPMWMIFLSCVTCSTGSTGGGIKLFRTLVLVKQSLREMFILVHPQAVAPLKIAGNVVPNRIVYSVLAFIFVYFMTVVTLTFALLSSGMDFVSAFTAVVASVNNMGPGLGVVGPATNYASLSDLQTWICSLAMFLGRIELFTFLLLFTPTFWRK